MITEDDLDEWEMFSASPFTTTVDDLARFYFFNYWANSGGEFPPAGGIRQRIVETKWYDGPPPSVEYVAQLCEKFAQEIQ